MRSVYAETDHHYLTGCKQLQNVLLTTLQSASITQPFKTLISCYGWAEWETAKKVAPLYRDENYELYEKSLEHVEKDRKSDLKLPQKECKGNLETTFQFEIIAAQDYLNVNYYKVTGITIIAAAKVQKMKLSKRYWRLILVAVLAVMAVLDSDCDDCTNNNKSPKGHNRRNARRPSAFLVDKTALFFIFIAAIGF